MESAAEERSDSEPLRGEKAVRKFARGGVLVVVGFWEKVMVEDGGRGMGGCGDSWVDVDVGGYPAVGRGWVCCDEAAG